MIKDILLNDYINNSSDILALSNTQEFKHLLNKISNNNIEIHSNLIHKSKTINSKEQFIFNLDNYISFLKEKLLLNQFEIKVITELTIYNKENSILFNKIYYYDDIELYIKGFKKMLMYNYLKNHNILKKYIKIKKMNFDELIIKLNALKNKAHYYLENINNNLPYYIGIIDYLENTSNICE